MTAHPQSTGPTPGETTQAAVLSFLAGPRVPGEVKRVDTHSSIVFLEPGRVLKVKRAVKLPYLDYSTLEKRRRACEDEIAINKPHAPAIYRKVVPITRKGDGFAVDGDGPVVEWAVEMSRFDETRTLDNLAARDALPPELGEKLAFVLLASHRAATCSDRSSWLASLPVIIARNTEQFRGKSGLPRAQVDTLHELSCRALAQNLDLLHHRSAAGQVRRCHGDAHLGNIVLIDGKPVLFDAIEFDPEIATTDVIYDVAFPLMDLLHFGQMQTANQLFNGYIRATWREQSSALALLPLFLSVRAAIRANVLLTKHGQHSEDPSIATEAERYFDLALRLLTPEAPLLLAIGGKSGTGKSVLARDIAGSIAPPPGALILRSDVIRKELHGVDEHTTLPAASYTAEAADRVYRAMFERAARALVQGVSVIVDAAFLKPHERAAAEAAARDADVAFSGIFLTADRATRLRRAASRLHDASDATADVALGQEQVDTGEISWGLVDASGSPAATLERAICRVRRPPSNA